MPAPPPTDALRDLLEVIATLRGPEGCPWDRAQTGRSLIPYLVEEAYELVEAIEQEDAAAQCAEAGDLLYLLLLIARIAQERGRWDHDAAARGIAAKMRRRHPGILRPAEDGSAFSGSAEDWEAVKAQEHPPERSVLDGIPRPCPP
ncbi:MAG: MazG nucleotide pyrophosphohydrolase domain-containing protein [Pseudomonadota bacterium]